MSLGARALHACALAATRPLFLRIVQMAAMLILEVLLLAELQARHRRKF